MSSRERILGAVAKTFLESGIEGITMKKVAQEAGIGKSTVYEYFDSKESMIAEAIIFSARTFVEEFYQQIWSDEDASFEELLRLSIKYLIDAFKSELGRFITLVEEGNAKPTDGAKEAYKEELNKLHERSVHYTKRLIDKGVESGSLRSDLYDLDVINFQRVFLVMCAGFSEKNPMVKKLSNGIESPIDYVYDNLMRLYGK